MSKSRENEFSPILDTIFSSKIELHQTWYKSEKSNGGKYENFRDRKTDGVGYRARQMAPIKLSKASSRNFKDIDPWPGRPWRKLTGLRFLQ